MRSDKILSELLKKDKQPTALASYTKKSTPSKHSSKGGFITSHKSPSQHTPLSYVTTPDQMSKKHNFEYS